MSTINKLTLNDIVGVGKHIRKWERDAKDWDLLISKGTILYRGSYSDPDLNLTITVAHTRNQYFANLFGEGLHGVEHIYKISVHGDNEDEQRLGEFKYIEGNVQTYTEYPKPPEGDIRVKYFFRHVTFLYWCPTFMNWWEKIKSLSKKE